MMRAHTRLYIKGWPFLFFLLASILRFALVYKHELELDRITFAHLFLKKNIAFDLPINSRKVEKAF